MVDGVDLWRGEEGLVDGSTHGYGLGVIWRSNGALNEEANLLLDKWLITQMVERGDSVVSEPEHVVCSGMAF